MSFSSIGDLAQNLMLRRQSAALQSDLSRLTGELVSGKRQDISRHVNGDFGPLATYQRSLQLFDGYASARADADLRLTGTQTALAGLQEVVGSFGHDLLAATAIGPGPTIDAHLADAGQRLESAVLMMNSRLGDRYLFSGVDTTTAPIADASAMMDELRLAISGTTTLADFNAAVDDWFDLPGGGFETSGYLGGAARETAIKIGPTHEIIEDLTADQPAMKEALRNLAKLALVAEGYLAGNAEVYDTGLRDMALGLIGADDLITDERAKIGVHQSDIAAASAHIETERTVLVEAMSKITDVDPFDVASELEAVQHRIETLYTITARNSRLNLMEYLR